MLYRQATTNGAPLTDVLVAFQESSLDPVKTGQLILSTSGGGYATSLKLPQAFSQLTEEELVGLSEMFINVYDDATSAITSGGGTPTDATVFARMIADDRLQECSAAGGDFTLLGVPTMGSNQLG